MKVFKSKIFSLLILLLTFACSGGENEPVEMVGDQVSAVIEEEPEKPGEPDQKEVEIERKLIKEGRVAFETDNLHASRLQIFESIKKHKAYTSSDQESKSAGRIGSTIVIRVPAENFDQLLSDATKGVASFDSKDIWVKDVTEEFLDVRARLKTKKELENRYIELLKKASSVTEILEVEKQLGQLRAEIESIEGRLKYLKNRISLSTLTIRLYQVTQEENGFGSKFKNGFKNGWENLVWFFVILTNIWPFVLIAFGFVFILRIMMKRK